MAFDTISLTSKIIDSVNSVAGFSTVGKGLASIFIFFHIASCGISLFQEQKFRLKMLYPFIVFFLVCNFSIVSGPTRSVIESVTESLCGSLKGTKSSALSELGHDSETGKTSSSVMEAIMNRREQALKDRFGKTEVEKLQEIADAQYAGEASADADATVEEEKGWLGRKISNVGNTIVAGISDAWNKIKLDFINSFFPTKDWMKVNAILIIATVLNFAMEVMRLAMTAFGAMLTGIIIAFGPITFALACFPEKMGVILSWFLRLLQYSLWVPIINLIDTFVITSYTSFMDGGDAMSMIGAIAAFVAAIVCLTQVPTIAGMIIEGVSGNASLSMGMSTVGGYMAMPAKLWSHFVMGGEGRRDKAQAKMLNEIVGNTAGGGGNGGSGMGGSNQAPTGMNTN